jgi:hypothetical protein
MSDRYPIETFDDPDYDDGTMPENVARLAEHVIGHRIVKAEQRTVEPGEWTTIPGLVLTLDNGKQVVLADTYDCCASTELESFWLDPSAVDHVILGVGTTDGYDVWHIYADFGDIMRLQVEWSCGNPFYYAYGFEIWVMES